MARRSRSAPPRRIARHLLRDLHHLFLVDDDALRLVEDVVDRGVQRFALAKARS
jgi:hypothetical protein